MPQLAWWRILKNITSPNLWQTITIAAETTYLIQDFTTNGNAPEYQYQFNVLFIVSLKTRLIEQYTIGYICIGTRNTYSDFSFRIVAPASLNIFLQHLKLYTYSSSISLSNNNNIVSRSHDSLHVKLHKVIFLIVF